MQNSEANNSLIVSFLTLRRLIGILGIALPLVMLFYSFEVSCCCVLQESISAYYHTDMRNIFVGILCAVGVFMMTYKGYDLKDTVFSIVAGFFALCVANLPTDTLAVCGNDCYASHSIGLLHYTAAAGLFLAFAYMSLFLFTKSAGTMTPEKKKRNVIYRVCGYTILVSLGLIVVHKSIGGIVPESIQPVFWLEAISLFAFGISWLVKGGTILRDKAVRGTTISTNA